MTAPLVSLDPLATLLLPRAAGVALPASIVSGTVLDVQSDLTVSVSVLGATVTAMPLAPYLGVADFVVGQTVLLLGTQVGGVSTYLIIGAARRAPAVEPHSPIRGESGRVLVSFTTLASSTIAVSFVTPFTAVPIVLTNIDSVAGASETNNWVSRPFSVTTAGFTLWVEAADDATDTWANIPVNWVAMLPGTES